MLRVQRNKNSRLIVKKSIPYGPLDNKQTSASKICGAQFPCLMKIIHHCYEALFRNVTNQKSGVLFHI